MICAVRDAFTKAYIVLAVCTLAEFKRELRARGAGDIADALYEAAGWSGGDAPAVPVRFSPGTDVSAVRCAGLPERQQCRRGEPPVRHADA